MANVYPFMTFELEGVVQHNRMISGVIDLYLGGDTAVALLILLVSIAIPGLKILLLLYVSLPLRLGVTPPGLANIYRCYEALSEWGMLEVYMLGVLVAIIKLAQMASIVLGPAAFAFAALMVTTTASGAALDPRLVWARVEARAMHAA